MIVDELLFVLRITYWHWRARK